MWSPPRLRPGDRAPSFRVQDAHGRETTLEGLLREGPLVLYFYPKDFTKICTRQACLFEEARHELASLGARVVGVSVDSASAHQAFAHKHGLGFPLLPDTDGAIARAYGALRTFGGLFRRLTFVIDREGIIRGVFHFELRARRHVQEVEALLRSLDAPAT